MSAFPGMPTKRAAVHGGTREATDTVVGLDGRKYSAETERELNKLAFRVFNTFEGKRLLQYLENITIKAILPPDCSDRVLRDMEGQRRIVGILKMRVKEGGTE